MFGCIFRVEATGESAAEIPTALLRLASRFSPRVEQIAPETVVLDLAGLERLFSSPESIAQSVVQQAADAGLRVNVAVAENMDAAIQAARGCAGITVIPPGQEATVLGKLPLDLISANSEMQETWKLWGLCSLGDLAALPPGGVAERLGPEGARLQSVARGAGARVLIPQISPPEFAASAELEYAVEELEPLSFILADLLHQVCASLEAHGKAVGGIRLRLTLENPAENGASNFERQLSLPVPLRDTKALLKLLWLDLESHAPPAPVIAVSLRAQAAQPRRVQNGLFLPAVPEAEKLELTLARIAKLVGAENTGSPELLDTHRPGAFEIRPFRVPASSQSRREARSFRRALYEKSSEHGFSVWDCPKEILASEVYPSAAKAARNGNGVTPAAARLKSCPDELHRDSTLSSSPRSRPVSFRAFRPPLPAEVKCSNGRPVRIVACGVRGEVVSLAGPWRTSGDWWTVDRWDREEWDIELQPFSKTNNPSRERERAVKKSGEIPRRFEVYSTGPSKNALYRSYRDLANSAWYVEGSYD